MSKQLVTSALSWRILGGRWALGLIPPIHPCCAPLPCRAQEQAGVGYPVSLDLYKIKQPGKEVRASFSPCWAGHVAPPNGATLAFSLATDGVS